MVSNDDGRKLTGDVVRARLMSARAERLPVDVLTVDGDDYRAMVTGRLPYGGGVLLTPTDDNGGGAAGTPDPDQLDTRHVRYDELVDVRVVRPVVPAPCGHDDHTDPAALAAFTDAITVYRRACHAMLAAWDDVPGDVLGDTYSGTGPDTLPSFDELVCIVDGWTVQPRDVPDPPRIPAVGERVRWHTDDVVRVDDGGHVATGTTGTVTEATDDGIVVRLDGDPRGPVWFTLDDGHALALALFGDDDDRLTSAWSPLDVCAHALWSIVAPLAPVAS